MCTFIEDIWKCWNPDVRKLQLFIYSIWHTLSQNTGSTIYTLTTMSFFALMAYPFCHISCDLYCIKLASFNEILLLLWDKHLKNNTATLMFSIWTSLVTYIWHSQPYSLCSKWPPFSLTHALTRTRHSLIALSMISCEKRRHSLWGFRSEWMILCTDVWMSVPRAIWQTLRCVPFASSWLKTSRSMASDVDSMQSETTVLQEILSKAV